MRTPLAPLALALALPLALTTGASTARAQDPYEAALKAHATGTPAAAIAAYSRALATNPRQVRAYVNRAALYLGAGQPARALADCQRALQLDPSSAAAYHNRALARRAQRAQWQQQLPPDQPRPRIRGPRVASLQQVDADLTQALTLAPAKLGPILHTHRALVRQEMGNAPAARGDVDRALEGFRTPAEAHYLSGCLLHAQGDEDGAKAAFQAAVDRLAQLAPARSKPAADEPDAQAIAALIGKLGDDSYAAREEATKALIALGAAVVPAVTKALRSADAEVQLRARRILKAVQGPQPAPVQGPGAFAPYDRASTGSLARAALGGGAPTPLTPAPLVADLERLQALAK